MAINQPPSRKPNNIFDTRLRRIRRARGAGNFSAAQFLHERAMEDIVDRLETVNRDFSRGLFYGVGKLTQQLTQKCGVKEIFHADSVVGRLPDYNMGLLMEEEKQSLGNESFDLIVSMLSLHTANDLIGSLVQYRKALKPDGLFLAVVPGGNSFSMLRKIFYEEEVRLTGGAGPRFYPFADIKQWGTALSRAGLVMGVTDSDLVKVVYENPQNLIKDLRAMGETSVLTQRAGALRRDVLDAIYHKMRVGKVPVEFDLIYLTGWAPHPSQPQPLKPGSAKHSIADAVRQIGNKMGSDS